MIFWIYISLSVKKKTCVYVRFLFYWHSGAVWSWRPTAAATAKREARPYATLKNIVSVILKVNVLL